MIAIQLMFRPVTLGTYLLSYVSVPFPFIFFIFKRFDMEKDVEQSVKMFLIYSRYPTKPFKFPL